MSNTNDFDSPDDLDQNLDQDMDFGEFEDDKKGKTLGAAWKDNPLIKFGLIGAAVLVVIVLVTLFGGEEKEAPTSLVSRGNKVKEAPGTEEVTPVMKEAMEEKNQQRIDEAQKQGISAIPTPIEPPKALLDVPEETEAEDPLLRWKQMQEERAKAQREQQLVEQQKPQNDPEREKRIQGLASNMSAQMGEIFGRDKKSQMQHMEVFSMDKLQQAQTFMDSGLSAEDGKLTNASAVQAKPANVLLAAGKVEYAQMMLEANSDIPGPVVAMMASGTFNGGRLLGKFKREQDYLVIEFNTLVTKRGTSVPISAIAVDPQTSLTGVATDVDHRYFQRIVLPAAAKFVEGLGEAYAETTTTTSQSSSSTVTSSEDLDTKQELGKAVSEAASQVADVLEEDGKNVEPLVVVAAGTPVGVLFMESITDQTLLRARAGVSSSSQQQPQQNINPNGNPMLFQGQPIYNSNLYQQLQSGLQNQQYLQQGVITTGTTGQ